MRFSLLSSLILGLASKHQKIDEINHKIILVIHPLKLNCIFHDCISQIFDLKLVQTGTEVG